MSCKLTTMYPTSGSSTRLITVSSTQRTVPSSVMTRCSVRATVTEVGDRTELGERAFPVVGVDHVEPTPPDERDGIDAEDGLDRRSWPTRSSRPARGTTPGRSSSRRPRRAACGRCASTPPNRRETTRPAHERRATHRRPRPLAVPHASGGSESPTVGCRRRREQPDRGRTELRRRDADVDSQRDLRRADLEGRRHCLLEASHDLGGGRVIESGAHHDELVGSELTEAVVGAERADGRAPSPEP